MPGILGLGHTRYSTAGGGDLSNTQPFMVHTRHGMLAIAHNGELVNADKLRRTVRVWRTVRGVEEGEGCGGR